jgi:hypothetical protein
MQYSIIYSFDTPRDVPVHCFQPPKHRTWQLTEDDSQYEYGYLEGEWTKGKHRKYCKILNQEQFEDFLTHCDLRAERCHTMGSIGFPNLGWSPAVAFNSDSPEAILSAYVTPVGTRLEIIDFLRDNEKDVPQCLLDSPEQKYLFKGIVEDESPHVWDKLEEIMWEKYS